MASLDTPFIISILLVIIVCFFAYQWMAKRPGFRPSMAHPSPSPGALAVSPIQPAQEQKEPLQQNQPANNQQPIQTSSFPNAAPAQFDHTLRHPEQLFHQPQQQQQQQAPMQQQQQQQQQQAPTQPQSMFSPEMAQNGGLLGGTSLMAFESYDPTGSGLTVF